MITKNIKLFFIIKYSQNERSLNYDIRTIGRSREPDRKAQYVSVMYVHALVNLPARNNMPSAPETVNCY